MLTLYTAYMNVQADVMDVEKEFLKLRLRGTDTDRKLITLIEQGMYNDTNSYIDRFGYKLHYGDLSTGCKAALCVANLPDKIISLAECGINARDAIITVCTSGSVIVGNIGTTISSKYGTDCNVKIGKYIFTDIDRLNKYIQDEMPYEPDMSLGGIETCI